MDKGEVEDWLRELNSLSEQKEGDGRTVAEISGETGHCVEWVRSRLNKAKKAGLLIMETVTRIRLDGKETKVPAYRFKKRGDQ